VTTSTGKTVDFGVPKTHMHWMKILSNSKKIGVRCAVSRNTLLGPLLFE